jgi:hypothetical protein
MKKIGRIRLVGLRKSTKKKSPAGIEYRRHLNTVPAHCYLFGGCIRNMTSEIVNPKESQVIMHL